MFLNVTKKIGKPLCLALYAGCIALCKKKKFVPLILLVFTHLVEYILFGYNFGREKGLSIAKSLLLCLLFGFTWWLPIKSEL